MNSVVSPVQVTSPVIAGLQKAVAQSYALTALAQNAHWNVLGTDFFQLHAAFGSIYDAAFDDADDYAERIRALQGMVKVGLSFFEQAAGLPSLGAYFSADEAVRTVLSAITQIVVDLKGLMADCRSVGDTTTENFIQDKVFKLEKSAWMLRSYLR